MFVQYYLCQVRIKNNSTKFLTLSKLFANFDFTVVNVSFNIALRMELAINIILSQSSINMTCFNRAAHKHSSKKFKRCLSTVGLIKMR